MDEQAILKDLIELFPVENQVVPYVELKFRLGPKYGEDLETMLKKLVDIEILSRFEFNNTVHYKSKKDIPLKLNTGDSSAAQVDDDQIKELSKLVFALATTSGNKELEDLANEYKKKYM